MTRRSLAKAVDDFGHFRLYLCSVPLLGGVRGGFFIAPQRVTHRAESVMKSLIVIIILIMFSSQVLIT